jgi:ATP-binding cassette subfamily C protein
MDSLTLKEKMEYHVISGTINVFLVKQPEVSGLEHKRHYLFSASEGTTIYGGKAEVEDGSYELIAIGKNVTKVEEKELKKIHAQTHRYLQEKANKIEMEINQKKTQYIEERTNKAALLDKAVNILTDNVQKKVCQQSGSIYFKACQVAANALGLEIEEPTWFEENQQQPRILMKTYFQKTNMRYRSIKLDGKWRKNIEGVIIAFKSDNEPFVLIAGSKKRCEMIDLKLATTVPVDEKIEKSMQKDAFMIYRPLPERKISGRDLLKFGLRKISKKDIMLLMFSLIGIGILGMAVPLLTGLTVSWIIPQGNINLLTQIGIILAVTALASFFFNLTRGYIMLRIEGKLDVDLQTAIWDRLLNLPLGFFKSFTSAELASRALGITMIRDIISGPVMIILLTSIYSLFCWLVLFYYKVSLAAVTTLMIGAYLIINCYFVKQQIVYESRINQLTNKLAGLSFQLVKGAIKIQKSGAAERAYFRWTKTQSEKHKAVQSKTMITSKMEAFNGFYLPVSIAIIYWLITTQSAFSLPVGHFVGFNSAYMIFMTSMFGIFSSLQGISQVLPLYDRGKIILQTKPESKENKQIIESPSGKIEVHHVRFRYGETSAEVLKDISLEIKPGEYIGIVGTSGSGKSTLFKLLLGFETDFEGKITYDDQDIKNIDLRELRKKIGVVLQTGKLMSDSIYHNIVATNLHLNMEAAWEAASIAGIDEDIKAMPMGMYTMVMEGAGTISGGQKQRILIARAVVSKPGILFFDEATSALDNITQTKIKQSLDSFFATRIVIAHRLSTVKNCDRIIVLDRGEIKEMGNYEMLMKKRGIFYDLAKRQLV